MDTRGAAAVLTYEPEPVTKRMIITDPFIPTDLNAAVILHVIYLNVIRLLTLVTD